MASVVSREAYFETELGATGSFYHDFSSWPAYTRELVGHWRQADTLIQVGLGLPLDSGRFVSVPDSD